MSLLAFLLRYGPRKIVLIAGLGLLGGFISAGFIALINAALHSPNRNALLAPFIFLGVARLATNWFGQALLVRFSHDSLVTLSDDLCRGILSTPLRKIEQIGPSSIMARLTDDISALSAAIYTVPALATNGAVLIGCGFYLAKISPPAFLGMLVLTALGMAIHHGPHKKAMRAIEAACKGRDILYGHFRSLTEGIKELKMNRDRKAEFLDSEIGGAVDYVRRQSIISTNQYLTAAMYSQTMFYVMMGLLLFLLPTLQGINPEDTMRYAFVALYVMAPVWGFIGSFPALGRGQAALKRIESLRDELREDQTASGDTQALARVAAGAPLIELERVCFTYRDVSGGAGFTLGPVSVTVHPGKLIFIVGGNGSGKSTLVKLLTGLYSPDSGEIRVNGRPIADPDEYRQLFSTVFSDFYLFNRLLGMARTGLDRHARKYLERLNLAEIVNVRDGMLSSTALSQGQRRRLALLTAYLEDRPIYVFDEWAADQDPSYKQVFYTQLLPELKAAGKTVIVITHDDRYFHTGDYILELDYGRVAEYRFHETAVQTC